MDITEQLTHESRIALAAAAEITRLRARLEVRDDGGPDGILCRDESIRMQDAEIDRLRDENAALMRGREALRALLKEARGHVRDDTSWSYDEPVGWLGDRIDAAIAQGNS